jgi:hypothetical protein
MTYTRVDFIRFIKMQVLSKIQKETFFVMMGEKVQDVTKDLLCHKIKMGAFG